MSFFSCSILLLVCKLVFPLSCNTCSTQALGVWPRVVPSLAEYGRVALHRQHHEPSRHLLRAIPRHPGNAWTMYNVNTLYYGEFYFVKLTILNNKIFISLKIIQIILYLDLLFAIIHYIIHKNMNRDSVSTINNHLIRCPCIIFMNSFVCFVLTLNQKL